MSIILFDDDTERPGHVCKTEENRKSFELAKTETEGQVGEQVDEEVSVPQGFYHPLPFKLGYPMIFS
jgi:hypothetical protein